MQNILRYVFIFQCFIGHTVTQASYVYIVYNKFDNLRQNFNYKRYLLWNNENSRKYYKFLLKPSIRIINFWNQKKSQLLFISLSLYRHFQCFISLSLPKYLLRILLRAGGWNRSLLPTSGSSESTNRWHLKTSGYSNKF